MNLSFDIKEFINQFANNCCKVQKKTFEKNEVITTYIEKRNQLCILVHGNADLVRYDLNGNRTIVEHFTDTDIFGEVFYDVTLINELLVEAREKCEVLFYAYNNIHTKCKNNCKFHQQLSEYLPELILNKRSTRDKLLGYFTFLSTRTLSKIIKLPLSLTDLADYLSVDRSAMMRELKILKEDGFIKKDGNKITLLYK